MLTPDNAAVPLFIGCHEVSPSPCAFCDAACSARAAANSLTLLVIFFTSASQICSSVTSKPVDILCCGPRPVGALLLRELL
jgi:hypothetical protein